MPTTRPASGIAEALGVGLGELVAGSEGVACGCAVDGDAAAAVGVGWAVAGLLLARHADVSAPTATTTSTASTQRKRARPPVTRRWRTVTALRYGLNHGTVRRLCQPRS